MKLKIDQIPPHKMLIIFVVFAKDSLVVEKQSLTMRDDLDSKMFLFSFDDLVKNILLFSKLFLLNRLRASEFQFERPNSHDRLCPKESQQSPPIILIIMKILKIIF